MKNLTELSFVVRHVGGASVLDAGAGTGRFTFPLRGADYTVLALDISRDMLQRGKQHAQGRGKKFPCVQGEIERLPFDNGVFDSVVSITVLRHFPDWAPLLDEYLRVIREGGRVIFDMASREQQKFCNIMGMRQTYTEEGFKPSDFDAGVTFGEMKQYATERGCSVAVYQPHDFFNKNGLLEHGLGEDYEEFMATLRRHLAYEDVLRFCEMVHRRFLPAVSAAVCNSVLIVLEKRPGAEFRLPDTPPSELHVSKTPENVLLNVLKHALGRRYGSFMREASRHMKSREVQRFVAFCRESLLPRLPLEAFWEGFET
ncbi:MAG: class I SAM-dependent methyltransferase [Candidatus Hydrogenedentota bacterium]